jgi:hypothetical protein
MQPFGLRFENAGFNFLGIQGHGFKIWSVGFRVQDMGFTEWGMRFRV